MSDPSGKQIAFPVVGPFEPTEEKPQTLIAVLRDHISLDKWNKAAISALELHKRNEHGP